MRTFMLSFRQIAAVAFLTFLAVGSSSLAQSVNLALFVRNNDPADPREGGQWRLVAKTDAPLGIGRVTAYLNNVDPASIVYGTPATSFPSQQVNYTEVTAADLGAVTLGGAPQVAAGPPVTLVYEQDLAAAVLGVGTPDFAKRQLLAPIRLEGTPAGQAPWDGATVLASGTFGALAPSFGDLTGSTSGAALLVDQAGTLSLQGATTTTFVWNDAIEPQGGMLWRGDITRSLRVAAADLNVVIANFNRTGKTWDLGDSTDGLGGHVEGTVNAQDMSIILSSFNRISRSHLLPREALASASEPSGAAACAIALVICFAVGRRHLPSPLGARQEVGLPQK